jgi:hypothetical protein
MFFMFCSGQSGQSSLEFLLLLLAFFSALALVLPAVSYSADAFFGAADSSLAKQIASEVRERASEMEFMGDGSRIVQEFVPARGISVFSDGNKIIFSSGQKSFEAIFSRPQAFARRDFNSKFFVEVGRSGGQVVFNAYSK